MSRLIKNTKRAILVIVALPVLILVIQVAQAAFSEAGTKRQLGSESRFEGAEATGTITIGASETDSSLRFYPHDNPPTCDASAKGILYCDDSESKLKLCNGTEWTAL